MIFRQLFDSVSSTYTYLIASRSGGEALLIDPVFEKTDRYIKLMQELDLKLVKVIDTHVHADHITAMGALRDVTNCVTVMGKESPTDVVSMRVSDDEKVSIEGIDLRAMYTPGHTDDSYSFRMDDRVFTGDTLLIRGTGRTDFQNGDAGRQYDSIFKKILTLPDNMLVYPAHDYKGDHVTTIAEERAHNPRLQVSSRDEYIDLMNNLNLPNPKMMDVAVPENMKMGITLERQREYPCIEAHDLAANRPGDMILVDLRDEESWGFHMEMSRQLWDEARHAMMGEVGFASLGIDWTQIPINFTWSRNLNLQLDARERHGVLFFIEQGLMPRTGKRYEWEVANESGDELSALFQDFDWADEVLHAQIGRRWYVPRYDNLKEALSYGDRCWSKVLSYWREDLEKGRTEHRNWWPELYEQACKVWGKEPDEATRAFCVTYESQRADLEKI